MVLSKFIYTKTEQQNVWAESKSMKLQNAYQQKNSTKGSRGSKRMQEFSKGLYFIRYLCRGMSVEEAADLVGVTEATGYAWLKRWNSRGYEGIIPDFGGGSRPFKLTEEQKEEL